MARLSRPELFRAINERALSPADRAALAAGLAAAHGWTMHRAGRTIDEYLRFLYLATLAETELTPSIDVDAVWHLHLDDAAAYATMCASVLGKQIGHRPGGAADADRFRLQYRGTLALYQMEFGAVPADIWPHAAQTFGARRTGVQAQAVHAGASAPSATGGSGNGLLVASAAGFMLAVYGVASGTVLMASCGIVLCVGAAALHLTRRSRHRDARRDRDRGNNQGSSCGSCGTSSARGDGDSSSDGGSGCGGGGD